MAKEVRFTVGAQRVGGCRGAGCERSSSCATQICHDGWDDIGQCAIDRFNPGAIKEDIDTDLDLLTTEYLDLVYLDDNPATPMEPVIEALANERTRGRIRGL